MTTHNVPPPLIMVVDDLEMIRQMLKHCLESYGYRVIEATNGQEAVEVARREHPDLILMDVSMPIRDGLTATRYIRQISELREVPIVAMSGEGMFHYDAALSAGSTAYLAKPIDLDQLEGLIGQLLSARPN